jgi:hypothetical protein
MKHVEGLAEMRNAELDRELDSLRARTPMYDRPGRRLSGLKRVGRWLAEAGTKIGGGVSAPDGTQDARLTIRPAQPTDSSAIAVLSELNERRVPRGAVLVAELDGSVIAAMPLGGGHAVTDPRRSTTDVVELLELRSRQLRAGDHELASAA